MSRGDTAKAQAKNECGLDLLERNELDDAEAAFMDALNADVMFGPAHNNLGKVYYEQSKFYLAAWEFRYAIKLMPNQPEPRNNLGLVFEAADQIDKAVDYYAEALGVEPDNTEVLGNLVRARIDRGDRGEDIRELLRELVLKDTRPPWVRWARETLVRMEYQQSSELN